MRCSVLCASFVAGALALMSASAPAAASPTTVEPVGTYHFKQFTPAVVRTDIVAVKASDAAVLNTVLAALNKPAGVLLTAKPDTVPGWFLVSVGGGGDEEVIRTLVDSLAAQPAIRFATPVLTDSLGKPRWPTPALIVGFQKGLSEQQRDAITQGAGAGKAGAPEWIALPDMDLLPLGSKNGYAVLATAAKLAVLPEVEFAESDMITGVTKSSLPNDTNFAAQWALHNPFNDQDMDAPEAWSVTRGSPSVIVVVLDDGVDLAHPDLNLHSAHIDFTGAGGGGGPPTACDRHGTPVAGCIAGKVNNGIGIAGIAPGCRVASAKIVTSNAVNPCDNNGRLQYSWMVSGLNWAQSIGARVTNFSISFAGPSPSIESAYASTRVAGIVHFCSSGNDGLGVISYPSRLPSVNAVGAVDSSGGAAFFSNRGEGLDFVAPGLSVWALDRSGADGYSPGDYLSTSGTSFASPYAAGVAALVLSAYPQYTVDQVEAAMQAGCVDKGTPGYDTTYGWGFINAAASLGVPLPDDSFEDNDTLATAKEVSTDAEMSLLLTDSNDYFKLVVPGATNLSITLRADFWATSNLTVSLQDSVGVVLQSAAFTAPELSMERSVEAGTYYLRVSRSQFYGGPYTLKVLPNLDRGYSIISAAHSVQAVTTSGSDSRASSSFGPVSLSASVSNTPINYADANLSAFVGPSATGVVTDAADVSAYGGIPQLSLFNSATASTEVTLQIVGGTRFDMSALGASGELRDSSDQIVALAPGSGVLSGGRYTYKWIARASQRVNTGTTGNLRLIGPGLAWREVEPAPSPSPRVNSAFAYDSARGVTVLFGGVAPNGSLLGDTWEWNGSAWSLRATTGPSPRGRASAAFAPSSGRVVLYGGDIGNNDDGQDTWEWDGSAWTHITNSGPVERIAASMCYDAANNRLVLFGGIRASGPVWNDTWAYNPNTRIWSLIATTGPSPRWSSSMEYDPRAGRQRCVLYGGALPGGSLTQEVWELVGNQWIFRPAASAGAPSPRESLKMLAWDDSRQTMVLFGGETLSGRNSEMWEYNGEFWSFIQCAKPQSRAAHMFAYDSARSRLILFGGGIASGNYLGDTWEFDGTVWTPRSAPPITGRSQSATAHDPESGRTYLFGGTNTQFALDELFVRAGGGPWGKLSTPTTINRLSHMMAFDTARDRLVLFGGLFSDGSPSGQTWEFDGLDWHQKFPSGAPSPRAAAAMVYDSVRNRIVLFGGRQPGLTLFGETFTFDGTSWTNLSIPGPSPRRNAGVAYDAARDRIVLFGGYTASGDAGDTWEFNGTSWTQISAVGPSPRRGCTMAYDPALGQTVLYGGRSGETSPTTLGDAWTWNGFIWRSVDATGPAPRLDASMVYETGIGKSVLFGGDTGSGFLNDTWELSSQTAPTIQTQPQNTPLTCPGVAITFGISVSGSQPLTYQWRKNGNPINPIANPSAATATLALTNVGPADVASYDCIVSNSRGSVTSNAAALTLTVCACSLADVSGGGDAGTLPDGTLDGSDFIAFINSFSIGDATVDATADVAGGGDNADQPDGTIDGTDFIAFINAFAIGC